MKKEREDFMRIAEARLRPIYKNSIQRRAWAAKMYTKHLKRNKS